jgi:hypothetical protein
VRIVGTVGGNIQIERVVLFNEDDEFATVATRLTNLTGSTLSGVAWLENLDPDQGFPLIGDFSTFNDVVLGGQFVRADATTPGFPGGLTIGLGSTDSRRVVSAEGFDNRDPFEIINSPVDPNGASADIAIALGVNFGSMAPSAVVSSALIMSFGRTTSEAEATYAANTAGTAFADPDLYRINATAGQLLEFGTSTPADGSGEFENALDPRLRLLDSDGNEVASDDNSGADGRNALLSLLAPATGVYYIEVSASPAGTSSGEYVLSISGNTPTVDPFQVAAINPADGASLLFAPTTITVDFNDSLYLPSVDASDLLVDGFSTATGVTQIDGDTLEFTIPGGLAEGAHTLSFAAGSILDVQQTPVDAFSSSFNLDATAPRVTATSLAPGAVVAPGSLSYQVTFSEPMKASNLSADDFSLHGNILGGYYSPTSFSFDLSSTVLTLNYDGLPEDNYTLTLYSGVTEGGNFTDAIGHALDGEFSGTFPSGDGVDGGDFAIGFAMDIATTAFPVPLTAKPPLGSLIYDPTASGLIATAGDTDAFTISVDAGQTISVLVKPTSPGLQPSVQLFDPGNVLVGSDAAGGAGLNTLITPTPTTSGTYTIVVGGVSGTIGGYNVQVVLNSALEYESSLPGLGIDNDSLATAQPLDDSMIDLTSPGSSAQRGAVLGQMDPGIHYTVTSVPYAFEDISATGTTLSFGNANDDWQYMPTTTFM